MSEVLQQIAKARLVPVVVMEDAADAEPLAEALIAGDLACAEVTFRTQAAADAVKRLARVGRLLVGAGTVLTVDQAKQAVDSGARFIVSPGFNPRVVRHCVDNKITVIPGVCTPSEIEAALEFGVGVVKFFPAEAYGGLKTLNALSAPYPMVRYVPTGGIGAHNFVAYLKHPAVVACGGSWMVAKELIAEHRFEEIGRLVREAATLARARITPVR